MLFLELKIVLLLQKVLFLVLKKCSPTKGAKFSAFKSSKNRSFLNKVPLLVESLAVSLFADILLS